MNIILGTLGANITLGLISSVTSTANGVFTLCSNIINNTTNGAAEVKAMIKDLDLAYKVKSAQYFLCELKISDQSPYTILYSIQAIRDVIHEISEELEKIHYRLQYNDNLWFGSTIRCYRFHNCNDRLKASLNTLKDRRSALMELMRIESMLIKQPALENDMSDDVLQVEDIDSAASVNNRMALVKKLDYINR